METRVDMELEEVPAPARLRDILVSFLKLGTASFGGGTVAWTNREVVDRRGWMTEDRFLQVLTVALVMPGANPVNVAVSVGQELRGYAGAAVAAFGMVAPPFCIILLLAIFYHLISGYQHSATVLGGLACVGIASMLQTGLKGAQRLKGKLMPIAVAVVIFALVGIVRLPMVPVVLIGTPLSVLACYLMERRKTNG